MRWFKMTQLSDRTCTKLSSDSKKSCKASVSGKFALGPTGCCCTFQTRYKPPFIPFPIGKERWLTLWTGHLRYLAYLNPHSFSSVLIPFIIFIHYCHRYWFCTRLAAVLSFVFFGMISNCMWVRDQATYVNSNCVELLSTLDVSRICTIPGSLSTANKQKGSILPLVNTAGFTYHGVWKIAGACTVVIPICPTLAVETCLNEASDRWGRTCTCTCNGVASQQISTFNFHWNGRRSAFWDLSKVEILTSLARWALHSEFGATQLIG